MCALLQVCIYSGIGDIPMIGNVEITYAQTDKVTCTEQVDNELVES